MSNWVSRKKEEELEEWFSSGTEIVSDKILFFVLSKNVDFAINKAKQTKNKERKMKFLVHLSNYNFYCKKRFREEFNNFIIDVNDLLLFISLIKDIRGFGNIIQKTVRKWLDGYDLNKLEQEINLKVNNWSFKDILKTIRPIPKNNRVSLIYKKALNKKEERWKKI